MAEEQKLTDKQQALIVHVLTSPTIEEACRKVKISRTTYYEWNHAEIFRREIEKRRAEITQEALAALKCAIAQATCGLIELVHSPREDVRRLACRDVIEFALRAIEFEDIEKRLQQVERSVLERRSHR